MAFRKKLRLPRAEAGRRKTDEPPHADRRNFYQVEKRSKDCRRARHATSAHSTQVRIAERTARGRTSWGPSLGKSQANDPALWISEIRSKAANAATVSIDTALARLATDALAGRALFLSALA